MDKSGQKLLSFFREGLQSRLEELALAVFHQIECICHQPESGSENISLPNLASHLDSFFCEFQHAIQITGRSICRVRPGKKAASAGFGEESNRGRLATVSQVVQGVEPEEVCFENPWSKKTDLSFAPFDSF